MLSDDALLAIFDFCANDEEQGLDTLPPKLVWHTLVHVCRRWRSLVFGSPRGLNLQLICTSRTPARNMLDIWPPLPLVIQCLDRTQNVDNIVAILEHRDRVCHIHIADILSLHLETVFVAMQEPFPELIHFELALYEKTATVLPDSFLGGSAPRLRFLDLWGIPFPGLPKLLLSSTHLTNLYLSDIPHSGYISPEEIATVLSTLTSLGHLFLQFQSPLSLPNRASRRPLSPKPFVLPVLTNFQFKAVGEYLEDLVVRIDAPLLNDLSITFFNQILFDTPQLVQFISRTSALKTPEKAHVLFENNAATIDFLSRASDYGDLRVRILCEKTDWQVSSLEQVCTWCLPPLSSLEDLYISESPYWRPHGQDNIENSLWLELLQPFTTVKNLYLSKEFALRIVSSLQELVGDRTTEVLPTLQNVFLEGLQTSVPVQEGIQQFIATRQASHPIAVSRWDRKVYD